MKRDGFNSSFWQKAPEYDFRYHAKESAYDTIIVGAGITGVTLALELQNKGIHCLLIEKETPGFGTTGGTTAHINNFFDASYDEIINNFGQQGAQLLADSAQNTLTYIHDNVRTYAIDCDFAECDFFLFSAEKQQNEQLDKILKAHRNLGVKTVETSNIPFNLPFEKAIRIEGQAQFHPLKYLNGMLHAYIKAGGALLVQQRVKDFKNSNGLITLKAEDGRTFTAKDLIWATHIPPGKNRFSILLAPYRSYALALKLRNQPQQLGQAADLYDPYHYCRYHRSGEDYYLIAGGFDHKTGDDQDTEKHFDELQQYVSTHFPDGEFVAKWSSQYYVSADGLPYIGRMPHESNIYISTGYGGNGMTFGSMAALIIPDLIAGKETALSKVLSPGRIKPIASAKSVISEGINASGHFIKDKLSAEELDHFKDIQLNEGKVVSYHNEQIAVYRDQTGMLHLLSPTCPHMGCMVNWNPAEKSWDCPCHGSRFDIDGKLLNGPAVSDLSSATIYSLK
ncbi:FAD-dependent oxidoreductase [Sphingobacterium thalpophilum]|uniref:FAD-dependent oxidoreductase n=1 Tax=Sphingobacterium thalpophilum TaxID=259 RepID=UPI0031E121CD